MGIKASGALFGLLFIFSFSAKAQTAPARYWVQFTDRIGTPFSIGSPLDFLSQDAIDRRDKQNIAIQTNDLPVNPHYIDSIRNSGVVRVFNQSKWFNAITIETTDTAALDTIMTYSFVAQVKSVRRYKSVASDKEQWLNQEYKSNYNHWSNYYDSLYGLGYNQIRQHDGHLLHDDGFTGQGMRIAVMDAGFRHVDALPVFEKLRSEGRIKNVWNFANDNPYVYAVSNHGMHVLSTMAGYAPGELVGTAPDADYYLFVTEDASQEAIVEEDNWIAAAELADSLGVDVFNTSLGYSLFDDSTTNHTYAEMDGNTTRITIASDIAASKGILVVTSAGNSGESPWYYITAPADADSALTVGAIDSVGNYVAFSSKGPTFDGRVKPDVVAQGFHAYVAHVDSTIVFGNGTSFSGPIICGLSACLWQAHPDKTNIEVLNAIRASAHLYNNPNDTLGYGIPNYYVAHMLLSGKAQQPQDQDHSLRAYPNPLEEVLHVSFYNGTAEQVTVTLCNVNGSPIFSYQSPTGLPKGRFISFRLDDGRFRFEDLPTGVYFLKLTTDGGTELLEKVLKY